MKQIDKSKTDRAERFMCDWGARLDMLLQRETDAASLDLAADEAFRRSDLLGMLEASCNCQELAVEHGRRSEEELSAAVDLSISAQRRRYGRPKR